ncbi:unnamed protein product [Owenia fusiformis]|uniref:Uncharacterized protein n=1 Tax=Owenia fusiformis TaxID=6347 RepID=A0A8J1YD48_OWEFU|nr:unnamed protein product [Owenia fusiformis]
MLPPSRFVKKFYLVLTLIIAGVLCKRKNVLFLVADDMRPELGAYYGKDFPAPVYPPMHTPNLDWLASRSLLLKRAYCQVALCCPSRTSLLTSRRPDTTHIYGFDKYFRKTAGNFTTIPQYFKENGYESVGMGKVFHTGGCSGNDDPPSWSEPYFRAPNYHYWSGETKHSWIAVNETAEKNTPLPDTQIAQNAIKVLKRVGPVSQKEDKPFFLAVGFHKPHLPFVFPERFLKYYPKEVIRPPANPQAPVNMPNIAWFNYWDLRTRYKDIDKLNISGAPNHTLPLNITLTLRRAYYSAVTFTDSLIGDIIQELIKQNLLDDTIISFWGDHGWKLGEHGAWCKETNFELDAHAPMMISVPGYTEKGIQTERLTEFVDLFPTLVEAAGLKPLSLCPINSSSVKTCTEGDSLIPLMKKPDAKWKTKVFTQFAREDWEHPDWMGYSMRTDNFRYTEWVKWLKDPINKPDWSILKGVELYDHTRDPQENYNFASDKSYAEIRSRLSKELRAGWRKNNNI